MFRVVLTIAIGVAVMIVTTMALRPRASERAQYRFMHCDVCNQELTYNEKLAGGRCPKCQPPKIGNLVPTHISIHEGGGNPYRNLNIALSFEAVLLLGAVVFVLYHPPEANSKEYRYTTCSKCKRKLRFAAYRAGGEGQCPGCKAVVGFPVFSDDRVL